MNGRQKFFFDDIYVLQAKHRPLKGNVCAFVLVTVIAMSGMAFRTRVCRYTEINYKIARGNYSVRVIKRSYSKYKSD